MLTYNNGNTHFSPFLLLSRSLFPHFSPFLSLFFYLLSLSSSFSPLPQKYSLLLKCYLHLPQITYFQIVIMLEGTGTTGQAGFCFIKGPVVGHCSDCNIEVSLKTSSFPFFIFTATQQDSFKV